MHYEFCIPSAKQLHKRKFDSGAAKKAAARESGGGRTS
jgi:hypothetical protein